MAEQPIPAGASARNPVTKPGLYDLDDETYHGDPAPKPSLSSGLARIAALRSPLHAWAASPRSPFQMKRKRSRGLELGSVAHRIVTGKGDDFAVLDFESYQSKTAKEARDEAEEAGKTPILRPDHETAAAMAAMLMQHLAEHEIGTDWINEAETEKAAFWQEAEIWLRCKFDWTPVEDRGRLVVYDYKTTASADFQDWQRVAWSLGTDIQAAFYQHGARYFWPGFERVVSRFIVQERDPPYAVSVLELDRMAIELAEQKVTKAMDAWHLGVTTGRWPSYPTTTVRLSAPAWAEARWLERDAAEAA